MLQASIEVEAVYDEIDFHVNINRVEFEEICDHLFRRILDAVERALRLAKYRYWAKTIFFSSEAGYDRLLIDDVIVLGGSSQIPKIQRLLSGFFPGLNLISSPASDNMVVHGAAVQVSGLPASSRYVINSWVLRQQYVRGTRPSSPSSFTTCAHIR